MRFVAAETMNLDAFGDPCRANVAHVRQSRPDSGLGFQVNVLKITRVVPSSLGSGFGGQPANLTGTSIMRFRV